MIIELFLRNYVYCYFATVIKCNEDYGTCLLYYPFFVYVLSLFFSLCGFISNLPQLVWD
jgi:hypothetical protein